jgi:hypothetical protein
VTSALEASTTTTITDKTIKKLSGLLVAILILLAINVFLLIWLLFVSLRGPRVVQRF